MPAAMHAKSDSEVTSVGASSPPRSPRRAMYYVQSPSQHELEKMSYGSSPAANSPQHFPYPNYHTSPIHHSRESSTSRFSSSIKNPLSHITPWRKLSQGADLDGEEGDDVGDGKYGSTHTARFYIGCFVLSFTVLFSTFSLILWAASTPYKPKIIVQSVVFHNFFVQAGMDNSGVPTDMLSVNSTLRVWYRNPSTFFGVHVTSTPIDLYYFQLKLASGDITNFYQSRKSQRTVAALIESRQVPLYGGLPNFSSGSSHSPPTMVVPLNLTFTVRSRAYVLGKLVKPKFYRTIQCSISMNSAQLGRRHNLTSSCVYQ